MILLEQGHNLYIFDFLLLANMPKKTAKKTMKKTAPKTLKLAKKPRQEPEAEDEEQMMGETDEFLDEDKPHERMPVKIRIGESIKEAEEEGIEAVEDQDELSPWEEGFAAGADHEGEGATCARCGRVLTDSPDEIFEREYKNEIFTFCSEKCARAGPMDQHTRKE